MRDEHNVAARLQDCAILFALPMDRNDFDAAIEGRLLQDYGAQLSSRGEAGEGLWEGRMASIAHAASELADFAECSGALVARHATLEDVSEATAQCSTVILFAHLLSSTFSARHIRDAEGVAARLISGSSILSPMVNLSAGSAPGNIADALNAVIGTEPFMALLPEPIQPAARSSQTIGRALCRDLIDTEFDRLVQPGNCVELHDGAHPPGRFASAIAASFDGELDLSVCNSTILSLAIEMRFGSRVRLASRTTLTVPDPELRLTFASLRRHASRGGSYLDARREVAREFRAQCG